MKIQTKLCIALCLGLLVAATSIPTKADAAKLIRCPDDRNQAHCI